MTIPGGTGRSFKYGRDTLNSGRCLIYELNAVNVGHPPPTDWYVRLQGAGMTISVDGTTLKPPPGKRVPRTYCIRLDSSGGCKGFPGGRPASDGEIRGVLARLNDLRSSVNSAPRPTEYWLTWSSVPTIRSGMRRGDDVQFCVFHFVPPRGPAPPGRSFLGLFRRIRGCMR